MEPKQITVVLVVAGLVLCAGSFLGGRASKNCDCPTVMDLQPKVDSLTRRSRSLEIDAAVLQADIDTLRARQSRAELRRPSVQTQVHDAYVHLALPVDGLATILLASPDTLR
jgi:hypothetical protein